MQLSLVLFKDNGESKVFNLEEGKTIIGRQEDCSLRIPLSEISRKHAMVVIQDEVAIVRDLGSTNGTYVNNKRITEQELAPGDHIVLGPVVFTVQINGQPAEVKPAKTRLEAKSLSHSFSPQGVASSSSSITDDEDDDDPISALEALAESDDTAAIDMDDSFPGLSEKK